MDPQFRLRLVGNPVATAGGGDHPLGAERRHQLLAYLACRAEWVPRAELAELFWENHAGPVARRNLRRILHDVRRIPWLEGLEGRGEALRLRAPTDLAEFARAGAAGAWQEAARLGAGTLLMGLEKGTGDAFHEWLRCEREAHLTRWRECVARRREELAGDATARVALARFALAHDPLHEPAVGDLVEALRACGREGDAAEAYRQFAARLDKELGVEPTLRLAAPVPALAAVPRQPPASAHPRLIGRRLQQAQLAEMLRRPDCRRATIHGPGGVGKSTLAASARALLAGDFPDGVRWVGLRDLATSAQIPSRIAEACGLKGALTHDPLASLAARIGERRLLLVLDNCEHLPEVAAVGDALIAGCPNLKILHASRARIGCEGERLLPLAGLEVPDADEHELEALRSFDSVRLFEARAQEVDPGFDARRSIADIVALVRMVEGLPLAIEMAAACTRLLPLGEVVRDISSLLDLEAGPAGAPAAERGLRASFEHSWRLLPPGERAMLARLAVIRGSFSLAAASRVAGADLGAIAALADKSLVGRAEDARFCLHPLIRELAREHLDDEGAARRRHAAYYADVMVARAEPATAATVPWGHEDLSHCLDAWRWASAAGDTALLRRMALPLVRLFNRYLRWQVGIETLQATLATLEGAAAGIGRLRAELTYGLALCRFYNGELEAAEEAARRSLRLCHALRDRGSIPAANLYLIGAALGWRGEMALARRFLGQSLAVARAHGEHEAVAKAIYGLAFLEQAEGNWERSRELYRQSEAIARGLGTHQWLALSLNGIGVCWLAEGRTREALAFFDQGIAVCTEHEVHGRRSFLQLNRGLALLREGDLAQAAKSIERSVREAKDWNISTARVEAHLARCALLLARRDLDGAREELRVAMQVGRTIQSPLRRMAVVRHWGQWLVHAGELERGIAVLEFVRADAMSQRKDRDAAQETLARVAPARPPRRAPPPLTRLALEQEILEAMPPAPRAAPRRLVAA